MLEAAEVSVVHNLDEQDQVERHLEERVAPVIPRVFSCAVWLSLADS